MMLLKEKVEAKQVEEWVLKEYDFYPEKMEERDNHKVIYCQRGAFILKATKAPKRYVHWLADMLAELKRKGFASVLPFYPNKYGDRYVSIAGRNYYVLPLVEQEVEEKDKGSWKLATLRLLAELHQRTVSSSTRPCPLNPLSLSRLEKRWRKRLEQLANYKELAVNKGFLSPFEQVFVGRFNYLYRLGERAIRYLQEWQERHGKGKLRYVFCHGHVGASSVLHTKEGSYLLHFDRANMDSPARDLALYFRKQVDLSGDEGLKRCLQYLASYEEVFPLTQSEKLLLAIFLLFPEQVFKAIEEYYAQVKDWSEEKQAAYLKKQMKGTLTAQKLLKRMLA